MNIKLDENLPNAMADFLRTNHNVATVPEERLSGATDDRLLSVASKEDRILLTFDTDFADVRKYPPDSHRGIIVFRLDDQRWVTLKPLVERVVGSNLLEESWSGIAIVDSTRIRIRSAGLKE